MGKKKDFDPFDFTIKHGSLTIGTIGVTGLAGRMPSSPQSENILQGMDTIKVIPTVHVVSGVFDSLGHLERSVKKRK